MTDTLRVRRLVPHAQLPARQSQHDAGYDIFAVEAVELAPGARTAVATGIALAVPQGTYGRVAPRSGLAFKHGIDTMAGVIDAGYRGELRVVLINLGQHPFIVAPGDRIAQLVLERIATPTVEEVDSLDDTDRGAGGFGSTGTS